MPEEQRRGNNEARKPKAAKSVAVAPVSPFVKKGGAASELPPKREG